MRAPSSRRATRQNSLPPEMFPADVAYICSVLAFNLRLSLHLQPFLAGTGQSSVRIQLAVAEPPSANNVVVSLVRTPADAADLLGGVRLVLRTTRRAAVSSLLSIFVVQDTLPWT